MSTEHGAGPHHWDQCADVYDFLEQVRLRPGVWVPGGSLEQLQAMLIGYQVALGVHSVDEPFDFWPSGPFSAWLGRRYGGHGPLDWAVEIARVTPAGSTPVEEFFTLLDHYRNEVGPEAGGTAARSGPGDPGLRLMLNTFVTLYWRRHLLEEESARLRAGGYRVVTLSAAEWATDEDMHRDLAAAFGFPDYYGHNLDAFNDCFGEVRCYEGYQEAEVGRGLVTAFTDYDRFAEASPRTAQIVLDIIADQARRALTVGNRVICLVHSNDPDLRLQPVGATPVRWNDAEWLDASRRP
ncbi:barstar family protein [Streptacidiphilus sp. N1-12]|uniref:Barstar family protein n=2 Tax=Streptacidiphilus alkalitolerans TaxID=3342712 RepID=A0ABV6V533_9ACTN